MRVLAGYEIDSLIGRGPSGAVYLARSSGGMVVAVKVVPVAGDEVLVRQLADQASAVRAIGHPHLLAVHDVVADGERAVIVMDHAPGGSLGALVAAEGRVKGDALGPWAAGAAEGLRALHDAGALHGDLKPSNLLIGRDGQPLLADIGLARLMGGSTYGYSDPYRRPGEALTPSSDVYSFGVVCYEALAGHPPFSEESAGTARPRRRAAGRRPLAALAPDAEPGLVSVIEQAIAVNRLQRITNASELAEALDRVVPRQRTRPPEGRELAAGSPRPLHRAGSTAAADVPRVRPSLLSSLASAVRRVGGRSRGARVMSVLAFFAIMVVLAALTRPARAPGGAARSAAGSGCRSVPPAAAPGTTLSRVALSGSGCTEAIAWKGGIATVIAGPSAPAVRFEIGLPTDVLLVGEWSCRPPATPALYRPSTGQIFLFSGWARSGEPLRAGSVHQSGVVDGSPEVQRKAMCDRVVVRPRPG